MAEEDIGSMSEDEIAIRLAKLAGSQPTPEEKYNVHAFLTNVVKTKDTTRLGNLKEEELGTPVLPLRTYQELALFCDKVANMSYFSEYLMQKGQILTASSLSKEAKLLNLSVVQKREIADVTKRRKYNRSWFKPKGTSEAQQVQEGTV